MKTLIVTNNMKLFIITLFCLVYTNSLVSQETDKNLKTVSNNILNKLKDIPKKMECVLYNKEKSYEIVSYVEKCSIITPPLDEIEDPYNLIAKGKDHNFIIKTLKFINKNNGFAIIKKHKNIYYSFFLPNKEPIAPPPKN